MTISSPPIGAIAYGRTGVRCIITALETDRVILRVADGTLKRVPLTAIARWELPSISPESITGTLPKALSIGQRCRLKATNRTYTLIEIYRVYCGLTDDDQPFYEQWARLRTLDGKPAHWKLNQLEAIA